MAGERTHPICFICMFISILTPIPRSRQGQRRSALTPSTMRIWDTQKGAVINDIDINDFGEIVFSEVEGTITLIVGEGYHMYDGSSGTRLCSGEFLQSHNHHLGAHWAQEESLWFATSFETDGRFVIDIQELQPTSDPPLLVVKSFPIPPQGGKFSFCPISFHASFVSEVEVVILDVQDSKVLLQTKATQPLYTPPGYFSPQGRFFACGTLQGDIYVWRQTAPDYLPWSSFRPRSPLEGFLFSPAEASILSWSPGGVQLLHPHRRSSLSPPHEIEHYHRGDNHFVASSAGTHILVAQQEGSVISRRAIVDPGQTCSVFDCPTLTTQQSSCWCQKYIPASKWLDTSVVTGEAVSRVRERPS